MAKDFYGVLGLQKGASADDVKKAYRRLSKELHPDKHPSASSGQVKEEAERKFKEVNEAYEVLNNPQKKQMYDQFGEAGVNGQAGGFGGGGGGGGGFGGGGFSGFDFGNAESFGDIFEGFFGGGGRGRSAAARQEGRDLETELMIDLAEVVTGVQREVRLHRQVTCDQCKGEGAEAGSKLKTCAECGGTGQVTRVAQSFFGVVQQRTVCPTCRGAGKIPEKPCKKCEGEGRMAQTATVTINIPAGIDEGQTLKLRGEGDAGRRGSAAGDLYVHVHVRPDSRFDREGADIRTQLDVAALDAILGATADVATVQGNVSLKIPEGTQPDQIMRIKGKGLPVLNTHRFGDHFVTIKVKVPTKLSREERKLLEEWRRVR